jgi:predicted pyridoxine 5'-phosphate oxidase superfamily flavin-nucleotide-binding protein
MKMAKMPQEVINFLEGPGIRIVVGFVDSDGTPSVLPKGKLLIIDDETVAFADRANIKLLTEFKTDDKAAIAASNEEERFGYQIKGTFQEYQTSGALFDEWAENMGGPAGDLVRMGLIKVDKIYAFVNSAHGKQIV